MRSRLWLVVLAASVGLNLFLAGLWLGGGLLNGGLRERGEGPRGSPPPRALERLPPERRAEFRALLRREAAARRTDLQAAREARRAAVRAVAAEPFDRAAAEAALATARDRERAVQVQIEGAMLDYAATLVPEQRQAVARAIAGRATGRQAGRSRRSQLEQ